MASTGVTHPSASYVVSGWTNAANTYALDSTYASVSTVGSGAWGGWYNYTNGAVSLGSLVPSGATIEGIEIKVTGHRLGGTGTDIARLALFMSWNAGTSYTASGSAYRKDFNSATDIELTFGGPTDLWGRTWSSTEFADAVFDLGGYLYAVTGTATGLEIDYITLNVYYVGGYTDTITITDSISPELIILDYSTNLSDALQISDSQNGSLSFDGFGTDITDTSPTISDSLSTYMELSSDLLDSAFILDSVLNDSVPEINITDTITIIDSLLGDLQSKSVTDIINISDSTSTELSIERSLSDNIKISETVFPYRRVYDANYIEDYTQTFVENEFKYRMISFTALDTSVSPSVSYTQTAVITSNTSNRIYFSPPVTIDETALRYTILQEFADYVNPSENIIGQFGYIDNILNTEEARTRIGTGLEDNQYYYYTVFVHKVDKNVAQSSFATYDDPNSTQDVALSFADDDFDTRLLNYWPNVFKKADTTDDLEDLMKVFGFGFNELYGSVKTFDLTNPDKMLHSILPGKSLQTGLSSVPYTLGVDSMRRVVSDMLPTWELKGTKQGIVDFIRILTTWDVTNGSRDASAIIDTVPEVTAADLRYIGFWSEAPAYIFTVEAANATLGDTYTASNKTFTVTDTIVGATTLETTGPGMPAETGTLTLVSGSGDASIVYTAVAAPHGNLRLFGNVRTYPPEDEGPDASPSSYVYTNDNGVIQYEAVDLSGVAVGDIFVDGSGNRFPIRQVRAVSYQVILDTNLVVNDDHGGFIYRSTIIRDTGRFYAPTASSGITIPGYFTFRQYDVIINNIALYVGEMTDIVINGDGTTTLTDSTADFGETDSLVGNFILPRQDKVNELFVIVSNTDTMITMIGSVQNAIVEGEYAVLSPLNAKRFSKLLVYMKEFEPSFAKVAFQFT